jgi:hypothetical protein
MEKHRENFAKNAIFSRQTPHFLSFTNKRYDRLRGKLHFFNVNFLDTVMKEFSLIESVLAAFP